MAIPFFDSKEGTQAAGGGGGDQVDGPGSGGGGGHNSSSPPTPIPISATLSIDLTPVPLATAAAAVAATSAEATSEEAVAWKLLAIAMCKALKDYYQQTGASSEGVTSAVVQILPNGGQLPPAWQ